MAKKPADELEMEGLAEAELHRLKRQYKFMENDRNKFANATSLQSFNTKKVLESLRKEHSELTNILGMTKWKTNVERNDKEIKEIEKLLQQHDELAQKIAREKAQVNELEEQIRKVNQRVQKLEGMTDNECEEIFRKKKQDMALNILENTLNVETTKLNNTLADNTAMREEIESMLKQRALFNSSWKENIDKLTNGKRYMMDLIEQSTLAYDMREELCRKLQALKDRNKSDLLLHQHEMKVMQRKLDHDSQLQQFLDVKGQRRVLKDLEAREAAKKQNKKDLLEQKIQKYKQILEQIQTFSKENDVERLGSQFLKQEEENFALFNYVNELNEEVELLTENCFELKEKIAEQTGINEERKHQEQETLESLKEKLEETTEKAKEAENRQVASKEKLNGCLEGIGDLFAILKCNKAPVLRLLGEKKKVTIDNVHLYMSLIRNRIEHVRQMVFYETNRGEGQTEDDGEPSMKAAVRMVTKVPERTLKTLSKEKMAKNPCPVCEKNYCPSNENDAPLSRDELKKCLINGRGHSRDVMHNLSKCPNPLSIRVRANLTRHRNT